MVRKILSLLLLLLTSADIVLAQGFDIRGKVTNEETNNAIEYASLLLKENGLWAITSKDGRFVIKNVPQGKFTLVVQCLGYATMTQTIDIPLKNDLSITLKEENLKLDEVEVVAQRKDDAATTSYTINRMALENQQVLNVGDIAALLPGGKTINGTLMNDNRLALRSGSSEKGNASFGTAIEIDGVRLDNNAMMSETTGTSTRNVGTSSIESVEIVTGIPSVEYGDLSNGVVKINTRKGRSPFIFEGKLNQHTRQIALNKGFDLGNNLGMLNMSIEHARSFSDAASPYTAYKRNILSLNYMNVFMRETTPLTLNIGLSGNVGGYNSKADPDEELDDYTKKRDNVVRANMSLTWLLNKKWITNLSLSGSFSYSDKQTENYSSTSSASTQPYIHSREEGYFIATDYDINPNANIILGPTGYWYVRGYVDSKPMNYSLKLKYKWTRNFSSVMSNLLIGAELTGSKNNGRGTYYEDMRYAPTWREYRYDELPAMNNIALYAEEKITVPILKRSSFELSAGIREDATLIKGSDYGTVSSLSPRINSRFVFWRNSKAAVKDLSIHVGWGKSVKLPSMQVLYPSPSYSDKLSFASTSTKDNTSYYSYFTYPSTAIYNPNLKWQYTNQTDVGFEMNVKGTKINVSGYHHRTYRSYMATDVFTPYTYNYTSQSALQASGIASANRSYTVDEKTGVVTVYDMSGTKDPVVLPYKSKNTFVSNAKYVNASPIDRYGIEWVIDFAQIRALRTSLRVDGNFYCYKGIDETLFADIPLGASSLQSDGNPYSYIGWYRGSNATSAGYSASASVANGALSKQANMNFTISTHIPKIRMIVSMRVETSLLSYRRSLSEFSDGTRGYVLESSSDYFGEAYDGNTRDQFIAIYPEYYSTWDNPDELIPFYDKFVWAKENDRSLFNDLAKLVVRSNYAYVMNPNRLSKYLSANLSVTKEIGEHVTISFYANNFFNNLKKIRSSQTDLESSLFGSSYIPSFYYGLSLKLKI